MDAPEALREFLGYIVANLIEHPDQATIAVGPGANGATTYRVQLAKDDVRHVIGKNGMTVSSIRSLMNVAAEKHGIKVSLRVDPVKEDGEKPAAGESADADTVEAAAA
jgi:predicted RNA-binding protein YlqC (UPF0109 family)